MHNIQIDSEFQAAAPVAQWLNTELLVPFSHNVRTRQNDDDIEAIAESMREKGFLPEKPLLVRPQGDRFEIVGGHTRHAVVAPTLTPDSYTQALSKPAPGLAWSGFPF